MNKKCFKKKIKQNYLELLILLVPKKILFQIVG